MSSPMDEESRPLFIPPPMCASGGVFSATTDGAANGGRILLMVNFMVGMLTIR